MGDERTEMATWLDDVASGQDLLLSPREFRGRLKSAAAMLRTHGPATATVADLFGRYLRASPQKSHEVGISADLMRRFVAEHEAARTPGPATERTNLVESIEALREAGGKAWDAVADPAEYLGRREGPDVSRLLAAAKEVLGWADTHNLTCVYLDRLEDAVDGHEAAQPE